MAQYRLHEEQPGLELAPQVEAPQVAYEQGLEYNHTHQNPHPLLGGYNGQQPGSPPYDPYRQSAHTGSSYSGWTPASDGKIPFSGSPPMAMEKPPEENVNLRIPKKRLWIILGSLAALLVVGLALGLGLGLGLNQSSGGSSSSASASSTPSPSSTATPVSSISCPTSNETTFTATSNSAEFIIYCAIDYNSNADSNTRDLAHMETDTAEDCINTCASNASCAGAGWGYYQPDSSVAGSNVCWLKSKLGTSHAATQDWIFVIKQ